MAVHEHHAKAKQHARCAVVTVSDTRTEATDRSGARLQQLLAESGHEVVHYEIVPDDPSRIRGTLRPLFEDSRIQAIFLAGGTGIAPRDTTFEAVRTLFEKEIEGFGELFRMLSYSDIGPAAMLSRATAGIVAGKILFSMPGSTGAVELAMQKLVLPELGHALHLLGG
jgi:molybdenum cofactor biosynthesis protein B